MPISEGIGATPYCLITLIVSPRQKIRNKEGRDRLTWQDFYKEHTTQYYKLEPILTI